MVAFLRALGLFNETQQKRVSAVLTTETPDFGAQRLSAWAAAMKDRLKR
jgi:hypothetical protein